MIWHGDLERKVQSERFVVVSELYMTYMLYDRRLTSQQREYSKLV